MLFDCQHYVTKNMHNGALPVHKNYNRDVLARVDDVAKRTMWNGSTLMACIN